MPGNRIIAVGDIHGHSKAFFDICSRLALCDDERVWKAEHTSFVLLGDVCDRGYDSRSVYETLISWQAEARQYNSALYFILGNHEIMNIFGYTVYNSKRELSGFRGGRDESGTGAFRAAFSRGGWLYSWLIRQRIILQLGPFVFAHGDLPVSLAHLSVESIQDMTMDDLINSRPESLTNLSEAPASLFDEKRSIVWSREAQFNEAVGYREHLESFLRKNGAELYVCGHTPGIDGSHHLLHGGRYLCIDTAMTFEERSVGSRSALVLDDEGAVSYYFNEVNVTKDRLPLEFGVRDA